MSNLSLIGFTVTGTLEAQDYALYVSHIHPEGQLNFNVHLMPRACEPWGHFSMDSDPSPSSVGRPLYDEPDAHEWTVGANKVSNARRGGEWDAVLLARLRFRTDGAEPTSL